MILVSGDVEKNSQSTAFRSASRACFDCRALGMLSRQTFQYLLLRYDAWNRTAGKDLILVS